MSLGTLIQSVCSLWMASEIALMIFRRAKDTGNIRDASSITWLNLCIYGSLAISLTLAFSGYGTIDSQRYLCAWIGLFLIIAGMIIRWSAILTLRRFFTVNVAIQDHHQLVKTGLYRIVRHPAYSGALLSFLGIAISLSNWIVLAFVAVPIAGAFAYRISIEERALAEAFGNEYLEYVRCTKRLIPRIF